jgi:hypothetical protein
MAQRPSKSRISQVINPGIDKRIPFGIVDTVIGEDGSLLGYMKNNKFYELGTDAATVDAEEKKAVQKQEKAIEDARVLREQTDPLFAPLNDKKLNISVDPDSGKMAARDGDGKENFIYVGPSSIDSRYTSIADSISTKDTDIEVSTDFDKVRNKMTCRCF